MRRAVLALDRQCAAIGLPVPVPEHYFAKPRRWRFDWAFPSERIAIEVEGGAWIGGRHTRGAGYIKDMEKYNAAVLRGWRVLRFTPAQVADGSALKAIESLFTVSLHQSSLTHEGGRD